MGWGQENRCPSTKPSPFCGLWSAFASRNHHKPIKGPVRVAVVQPTCTDHVNTTAPELC